MMKRLCWLAMFGLAACSGAAAERPRPVHPEAPEPAPALETSEPTTPPEIELPILAALPSTPATEAEEAVATHAIQATHEGATFVSAIAVGEGDARRIFALYTVNWFEQWLAAQSRAERRALSRRIAARHAECEREQARAEAEGDGEPQGSCAHYARWEIAPDTLNIAESCEQLAFASMHADGSDARFVPISVGEMCIEESPSLRAFALDDDDTPDAVVTFEYSTDREMGRGSIEHSRLIEAVAVVSGRTGATAGLTAVSETLIYNYSESDNARRTGSDVVRTADGVALRATTRLHGCVSYSEVRSVVDRVDHFEERWAEAAGDETCAQQTQRVYPYENEPGGFAPSDIVLDAPNPPAE